MSTDRRRSDGGEMERSARPFSLTPVRVHPRSSVVHGRCRGLSLVELLVSLAITAMLLTATMVAIDASFKAYAAAVETASTQTATRMVVNRLLTLVRTSTAHGPLSAIDENGIGFDYEVDYSSNPVESSFIVLIDDAGQEVRLYYLPQARELWLQQHDGSGWQDQPLLSGVTQCTFYLHHRPDRYGIPVLDRGTLSLTVETDHDNTLAIEGDELPPIEVFASTMPRKLD